MADALGVRTVRIERVLEGGSIEVNGAGTVLTTEQCLLNPNRNPQMSRADIEAMLARYLGVSQVVWLGDGIVGDDTDGHIDDLTRFVDETTLITVVEANARDENHRPLAENLERLKQLRLADGRKPSIIELPMPDPVYGDSRSTAGELCEFLHRQRRRHIARVQCAAGCARDRRAREVFPDATHRADRLPQPRRRTRHVPLSDAADPSGATHRFAAAELIGHTRARKLATFSGTGVIDGKGE